MKTKRFLGAALLLFAFSTVSLAQKRLDIVTKNNGVVSCNVADISYMEIVESAAEGELDGYWYLGWKALSNGSGTKTHYNGTEMLVFSAGPRMKWIKSSTESVYDLTYDEGGAQGGTSIVAQKVGGSKYTYKILVYEEEFLVLAQGTTRYYFYKTKEAATKATEFAALPARSAPYTEGTKLWAANLKGGSTVSNLTPMGKHFESYSAASDDDKAWLADPSNQPDLTWHESSWTSKKWTAKTINLYPMNNTPTPADVNQHAIGDCCMCAVFASFAYVYPEWIKSIIEKNGNNYTVHMFDPKGNPIDVVVDNKVMCSSSGGIDQVTGKNGVCNWATIMEKALMKWETRFQCNRIGGIGTEHAAPPFTGNGSSFSFGWGDNLFNNEYSLIVDYALQNGMISVGGFHESGVMCGELETVTGHAFTVMYPDDGATDHLFVMRNPWGNGGYPLDGKLKIPNKREVLRLVDFRLVFPGAQMAQYKRENLGGYTSPKFRPMPIDMNPSEEMLRMYGVKNYIPFPMPDDVEAEEE